MLTSDVRALAPGQGGPAAFLDAHGKVMALLDVYALEDRLRLALPPGRTQKTVELLDRYLISEKAYFEVADDAWVVLALLGPGARAALERASGHPVDLAPRGHREGSVAGRPTWIVESGLPGLAGYACWTAPEHGGDVWEALCEAGARPVGSEVDDVLRVEGGVPRYGQDVDETVIFPETRLESRVSYTKGCYIGQEVVARVKYRGHVNRALSGLVLAGERVPDPGSRIAAADRDVGRITSALLSPTVGAPIALGYVRREHFEPGSEVEVVDGAGARPARVVSLPFVTTA